MNTPVSFEIAKLLKEKGWDTNTYSNCWVKTLDGEIIHNKDRKNIPEHDRCETYLMQPTIAEVVMWLYEKHGVWVCIDKAEDFDWWKFNIRMLKDVGYLYGGFGSDFNSPTAAYEAAIEYTLKYNI